MRVSTLMEELAELESAEEFLNYFGIEFDPSIVQVNRLHILQRFHDYLREVEDSMPPEEGAKKDLFAALLRRAYQDFVQSNALTEKVFRVFHRSEPKTVYIPLDQAFK